jgi:disulfide bond formation protein DsbB
MHSRIFKLSPSFVAIFLACISAVVLAASFFVEYMAEIKPCTFCKLQRIPYALAIGLVAFRLFFKTQRRLVWILIAVVSCLGICLSSYHTAIQFHLVEDPCSLTKVETVSAFKAAIFKTKPGCAKIEFSIFGLPTSAINAMLFLGFLFLSVIMVLAEETILASRPSDLVRATKSR